MLVLSRKVGQILHIGDDIHITITEVCGDKVKIGIDAPRNVNIVRDELVQVMSENVAASKKVSSDALKGLAAKMNATKHETDKK